MRWETNASNDVTCVEFDRKMGDEQIGGLYVGVAVPHFDV